MDEMRELKRQLRREYKKRAGELSEVYRREADRKILETILSSHSWQCASGVFVYVSMGAEPDTRALIRSALTAGKRVYVPLCCPEWVMRAVRIQSFDELRPGLRGIPEPPAEAADAGPGELSLAIVPCVTVTASGLRLGHGGGYYDRFLCRRDCEALCLCYAEMLAESLPEEPWDVRMDGVLTEKGYLRCQSER